MNRKIHVTWGVSIFAILCLLIFQGFWLNRVIEFKKAEYLNLINTTLSGAVESGFEEYVVRNQSRLEEPISVSVKSNENFITEKDLISHKQMIKGQNNNSFNSFRCLLSFPQTF